MTTDQAEFKCSNPEHGSHPAGWSGWVPVGFLFDPVTPMRRAGK